MPESVRYNFKGMVAFVTGASTGIGRATAVEFGRHGAAVALVDVNEKELQKTARLVEEVKGQCFILLCDVSKNSDVKSAVDKTVEKFGGLNFAFNNAGIEGAQGLSADCTEENWDRVINTNLKGVWLCMRHEISQMLKQKGGAIVNCSSIAGLVGFPGIPAYTASKHGVVGLTKTAALEYAKLSIRVNAVCPGVIDTPMIERFAHGEAQAKRILADGEPIGRIGSPQEIAAAVLWLCSNQSSFVTGHALVADGGWVAQ